MNETQGRDAHWFDGDGMLSGVAFRRTSVEGKIEPEFVNQYILTDVFLSTITSPVLKTPILPSITTLVNPLSSLLTIILSILRTVALVVLSHLPGSQQIIKKISVANTAILYHDGRALATCESGVPMHISLPGLETVGWFNGRQSEGEGGRDANPGFGGNGFLSFMKEWTTAHVEHPLHFYSPYLEVDDISSRELIQRRRSSFCSTVHSYHRMCITRSSHQIGVGKVRKLCNRVVLF